MLPPASGARPRATGARGRMAMRGPGAGRAGVTAAAGAAAAGTRAEHGGVGCGTRRTAPVHSRSSRRRSRSGASGISLCPGKSTAVKDEELVARHGATATAAAAAAAAPAIISPLRPHMYEDLDLETQSYIHDCVLREDIASAGDWASLATVVVNNLDSLNGAHLEAILVKLKDQGGVGAESSVAGSDDSAQQQEQVLHELVQHVADAALARLPELLPSHTALLLSTLPGLGLQPSGAWLARLLAHVRANLGLFTDEQVRAAAGGLLRYRAQLEPAQLSDFVQVYERQLSSAAGRASCTPRELEAVITRLSVAGVRPGETWLTFYDSVAADRMVRCPVATSLNVMASLVALEHHPSERLMFQFTQHLQACGGAMRASDFVAAFQLLPALGHRPSKAWLTSFVRSAAQSATHMGPGDVVAILRSAAAVRHLLDRDVIDLLLLQVRPLLSSLGGAHPRLYPALLTALAVQHYKPRPALGASLLLSVQEHLGAYTERDMASTLGAMAQVGLRPSPQWMSRFLRRFLAAAAAAASAEQEHSSECVAAVMTALDKLQYHPSPQNMRDLTAQLCDAQQDIKE